MKKITVTLDDSPETREALRYLARQVCLDEAKMWSVMNKTGYFEYKNAQESAWEALADAFERATKGA